MKQNTTIQRIAQAALLLLALLLTTAQTAWAKDLIYVSYLDPTASMGAQRKSVTNPGLITAETTAIGSADTETWYYVSGTVTNSNRINVLGTVNLILKDGCNFTVSKGIHVASGSALNIYAQSVANRGSLTASRTYNDAAIGGNGGGDCNDESGTAGNGENSGKIVIYGGIITTTNGNIGGGNGGVGNATPSNGGDGGDGDVTIYSGIITTGNYSSIGGGRNGCGLNEYNETNNCGNDGGGTVTLSWADASDRIYSFYYFTSDYSVTLNKSFVDDNGYDVNANVNDKHIKPAGTPYTVTIGSMPDGVTATADLVTDNNDNKNAVEGQVVTIGFSGVPDGKVPVVYYDYMLGTYPQHDPATVNGDGTVSFTMPAGNVTVTASELKKDIANCTATVPDQFPNSNKIFYRFSDANDGRATIGETVKDGENTLTLGIDYEFGMVEYANGSDYWNTYSDVVGDKCVVTINGKGYYAGSTTATFTIIASASGTWGDNLSWSLSEGTLTISGSGAMQAAGSNSGYPWYSYGSNITTVILDNGITTIPAYAFGGDSQVNTYGGITTFKRRTGTEGDYTYTEGLPTSLTSIGDNAFSYCTGATIIIPSSVTTFGTTPFNQVECVVAMLSDTGDNSALIGALSSAKYANVTLDGRTLYKDGNWNTLCLPFDMTNSQVIEKLNPNGLMELDIDGYYANNVRYEKREDGKYYDGSTEYTGGLAALHQSGFDATTGSLYLYFIDATSIEAGKPYIIKWNNTEGTESIVSPVFSGVKIDDDANDVTSTDGYVTFKGSYSPVPFTPNDKSVLFIGEDNSLYWPNAANYNNGTPDDTSDDYYRFNAFRSYFQLNDGLTVGDVHNTRMNFGDGSEETGIVDAEANWLSPSGRRAKPSSLFTLHSSLSGWYDLQGRRLESSIFNSQSSIRKKGLYILNGKKVVIK